MAVNKLLKKAQSLKDKAEENLNVEVKNGVTKETTAVKKGKPVDPSHKHKEIESESSTNRARVGFNLGTTLNMENYESLRADVWISDEVQEGETVEEAITRLKDICEEQLNSFVAEYR